MNDVFIDSSALVALLLAEPDWQNIAAKIATAKRRRTSAVAILETVMVVASRMGINPEAAESRLGDLLQAHAVETIAVDEACVRRAIRAFSRYGKGRHPARLNLGDCISYACAREHGLTLLYKGEDFAQTDLA